MLVIISFFKLLNALYNFSFFFKKKVQYVYNLTETKLISYIKWRISPVESNDVLSVDPIPSEQW